MLLALCLLALSPGCAGRGLGAEAAATVLVGDDVEVAVGDGWEQVTAGGSIPAGARVRTTASEARLELRSGELWLGRNAAARVDPDGIDVFRGETLVVSGGALDSRWTDVEVSGEGVYRLSPGVSPRLAVYSGTVLVRRPGEVRTLGALRQIRLATHRLPADGQPLTYREDDPWDQELLPQAIAFDAEVEQLRRGLDRQYGSAPQPPEFYLGFAPPADAPSAALLASTAEEIVPGGAFGPPADPLVVLFVADAVSEATEQTPQKAAEQIVALRQAGAFWGLVATEFGVTTADLADAVDVAQGRRAATGAA